MTNHRERENQPEGERERESQNRMIEIEEPNVTEEMKENARRKAVEIHGKSNNNPIND